MHVPDCYINTHSKWPDIIEMSSTTASKTITVMHCLFASYDLPEQLVSDMQWVYSSSLMNSSGSCIRTNRMRHINYAPYHLSSKGTAECFVCTFKKAMKAARHAGGTIQHSLDNFLLAYQLTPHATTGVAPSTSFLGRQLRTHLIKPVCDKQASQKLSSAHQPAHDY